MLYLCKHLIGNNHAEGSDPDPIDPKDKDKD